MPLAKSNRRWYQFSLRTLLLATSFIGLVLAPIVYYRQLSHRELQIKAELEAHRIRLYAGEVKSQRPLWLKEILGDDTTGLHMAIHVYANRATTSDAALEASIAKLNQLPSVTMLNFADKHIDDQELAHFQHLTNIYTVFLDGSEVTEDGLKYLRGYKRLGTLALCGTPFGDSGVNELARHESLEILYLQQTRITDDGLLELRSLPKLRWLDVSQTAITDAGLRNLRDFQTLEMIGCGRTAVTDAGVRELRELKNLTHLDLRVTKITDATLLELESFDSLQSVDVYGDSISLKGIQKLKAARPRLVVNHTY